MNITLIRPPAYSTGIMGAQLVPFLGVAYVAAAARKAGHGVDVIDMCGENITRTEVVREKFISYGMAFSDLDKRLRPSGVVGFTCTFSQDWVFHKELIRYVRRIFPGSILVAGGEHITALPEYCLRDCPELDICVIGEGEEIFIKLLDAVENKKEFSGIPGLAYRRGQEGQYCRTPRSGRIREIDGITPPAWDLTPMENYLSRGMNYHIRRGRTVPLLATRGCPYKCTFCSNTNMWGNPWIAREPHLVAKEMQVYVERYRAKNFVFSDLSAVVSKEPIIKLCNEIIRRDMAVTWQLPTLRTEAVDRGILELMYRSGCRELDFAIESGSREILGSVHKGNDPKKISLLVKDGLDVGMNLTVNIILGLPGERLRDFLKTYLLIIKLAFIGLHELNVFPFVPYPGSKLFEEFLDKKKIQLNDDYFFSLYAYADLGKAASWSENFGPRSLRLMRWMLLSTFYGIIFISHPKRIFLLFKNILRDTPVTKLEGVLSRVIRDRKQLCRR